jgi:hypothetical protein
MTIKHKGREIRIKRFSRLFSLYIDGRFQYESQSSQETLVKDAKDLIDSWSCEYEPPR